MKKYFLISVIFAVCCVTAKSQQYIYCELIDVSTVLGIQVNHGLHGIFDGERSGKGFFSTVDRTLKTKEGRDVTRLIDAMNFMSADGWEFVEQYVLPNDRDKTFVDRYWLLKKSVDLLTPEKKEEYNKRYVK